MTNRTSEIPSYKTDTPKLLVYKRQRFLFTFIQQLKESVTATELQKLVFLYSMNNNLEHYDFIPYKYGAYSFQLAQDIDILREHGYLSKATNRIKVLKYLPSSLIDARYAEKLRGIQLIVKTYKEFPYYAINSDIAKKLLDETTLQNIQELKRQLSQSESVIITIGYEGMSIERFINVLIKNDARLLCDIRQNPISRKFGFSQGKLQHIVERIGIRYVHLPELGIESQKRKGINSSNGYNKLFDEYKNLLPTKQGELNKILSFLASDIRVALMCYEKDPKHCHRTLVKDFIVERYNTKSEEL